MIHTNGIFSRKGRNIFQNPADFSEKSPDFSTKADSLWNHFSRLHPGRKRPHPLPQPGKISLPGCFQARNAAKRDRKYGYLYFRLSATAISSQRLLYSFSAWFSHPACRMGALFHWFRCGRSESARRQGPASPDAWTARRAGAPLGHARATPRKLFVLPALRHRHFVTAVIKLILRVVFPSGLPDGSPFSLVPLRAE